jgi:hypothetical protein
MREDQGDEVERARAKRCTHTKLTRALRHAEGQHTE